MDINRLRNFILAVIISALTIRGLEEIEAKQNATNATGPVGETQDKKPSTDSNARKYRMTYGRFLEYLEMGWVQQVDFYNSNRTAIVQASSPELGDRLQSIRVDVPKESDQLIQKLKENNIEFDSHSPVIKNNNTAFGTFRGLNDFIIPILLGSILIILLDDSDDYYDMGFPEDFGKSLAQFEPRPETGITFDDVAGIDEAKAQLEQIVYFLKNPTKYTRLGARIPKGVLLTGPPGTGKTLLAKAIANEAQVPFFNVSGSAFVEMFIGVGASRVRDLFKKASENAPCIVFIDEIDAVGRERGSGIGGGNDEREQTLNQLLTEMDGFYENRGVIVIAATNRPDILDPALLRPGRFDRQITIGLPNCAGRFEILKVHTKSKRLDKNISLFKLARKTVGFSGADLAGLLNEAAILTTRYKKRIITQNEIDEAINRVVDGIADRKVQDNVDKRLTAYHEVGRALVGSVLKDHYPIEKISLIPRGGNVGSSRFATQGDEMFISRDQLLARITTMLSGIIMEEIVFGAVETTTTAVDDLERLTNLARQMVTRYGMSPIGPIALENDEEVIDPAIQPTLSNRVDREVIFIIRYCELIANQIISKNRVVIDIAVEKLLETDILEGDEFREIINSYSFTEPLPVSFSYEDRS